MRDKMRHSFACEYPLLKIRRFAKQALVLSVIIALTSEYPVIADEITSLASSLQKTLNLSSETSSYLDIAGNFEDYGLDGKTKQLVLREGCEKLHEVLEFGKGNRFSVEYDPLKRRWANGKTDYYIEYLKYIYDQDAVYKLRTNAMDVQAMRPTANYDVNINAFDEAKLPYSPLETGQAFLLGYQLESPSSALSMLRLRFPNLHYISSTNNTFELSGSETVDGLDIKLKANLKIVESVPIPYIDTFAIEETSSKNGKISTYSETYKVESAGKLANGIEFPNRTTFTTQHDGVVLRKFSMNFTNVMLTSAEPSDVFTLKVPAATRVLDERLGIEYMTGNDISTLVDALHGYTNDSKK